MENTCAREKEKRETVMRKTNSRREGRASARIKSAKPCMVERTNSMNYARLGRSFFFCVKPLNLQSLDFFVCDVSNPRERMYIQKNFCLYSCETRVRDYFEKRSK